MSTIKIFYPDYWPSVSSQCTRFPPLHVSNSCLYPGIMVEILHTITKQADLTIQSLTALDFGYRLQELVSFRGEIFNLRDDFKDDIGPVLYELLENGTIDLVAQPLQRTEKRAARFAFTEAIYQAQNRVIRHAHRNQYEQIWSFFNTYDSFVWLAFGVAWLLQLTFCLMTQRCEAKMSGKEVPSVIESAFQILRIQLLQPPNSTVVQFYTKAGKFSLFFFSLVQCSILLGVFSSFILASIIHSTGNPQHHTIHTIIEELRSREYYITTTNTNKWIFEVFNTSKDFPYPELHQTMFANPIRVRSRIGDVIQLVVEDRGMLFNQDDDRSYFKSMSHCGLSSMADGMPRVGDFRALMAGYGLFFFSDTFVLLVHLGYTFPYSEVVILLSYYAAQYLIFHNAGKASLAVEMVVEEEKCLTN